MENATFSLNEWNNQLVNDLLPNTVILGLYLLIGLVGNAIVLIVYTVGMKQADQRKDRFFIQSLAVFDLLATVFIASNKIAGNIFPVTYNNDALCKSFNFFNRVFAATSDGLLLVITIQRFQKICRPFNFQMAKKHKRCALKLVLLGAVVLNCPVFLFYGIHQRELRREGYNISGQSCDHVHDNDTLELLMYIYDIAIFVLIVGVMCTMAVMYFFIARRIGRRQLMKTRYKVSVSGCSSESQGNRRENDELSTFQTQDGITNNNSDSLKDSSATFVRPASKNAPRKKSSATEQIRSHISTNRFTYMFMILTVLFIVSYFPSNVLKVGRDQYAEQLAPDAQIPETCVFVFQTHLYSESCC